MYHPDKYGQHNDALERFCTAFNEAALKAGGLIFMNPSAIENFREDGEIIHRPTGRKTLYDFEKRFSYYDSCGKFRFDTFGQFERKIQKAEITLSIQCSRDEKCFIIAWHEDYKKEKIVYLSSKTASGGSEKGGKRFTKDFLEIDYTDMDKFYRILEKAFMTGFNCQSFKI
ncbi:MAG TPA: hypothetical protein PKC69_07610 [Chitinophagaceae bacterium]|nr:hypothetical protein [Chitinophagaceae bacterium]